MVPVNLLGVFAIGPENFLCALLECEGNGRYIPVWLPPMEGATLAARLEEWEPRRPDAYEAMAGIISQATQGASSIELTSYYNGTFMATLTLEGGAEIDMRPSDALLLALALDIQVEAEETVVQQASMFLNPRDAKEHFGLTLDGDDDESDEAIVSEFMRELGLDEGPFDEGPFGDQPSS